MLDDLDGRSGVVGTGDMLSVSNVRFELEVDGSDARWTVETVSLQEAVSEPFRGVVEALVPGEPPPLSELLGRTFTLRIERGSELRTVRGIVRHGSATRVLADSRVSLHVVSSMWRLGLGIDSRTYLNLTIPELVERVVREHLGAAVTVDLDGLTEEYEVHEMLIQYQESPLTFISRWMEQEGIFFFFADGDDGERIVLADAMENLPFARSSNDGRVRHWGDASAAPDDEHVSELRHTEGLGVTRVALSEFDWTNPSLQIQAEQSAEGPLDPPAEIHDHADAVSLHLFDGRQYNHNTATRNTQIRAEAIALSRQRWTMRSNVVTAQPGHVLQVEGAPDGDLDGAYMIVRADSGGHATDGGTGSWKSSHAIVPRSVPYRPALKTPRPVVPGPETAFVVGPAGQEINTDVHGRVRVHFHWDRARGRTDEDSSCWLRVAHNWAGDGFGTFFLPRIGMEVVVGFLGGNPDRPLVSACVYNGTNLAHVDLPAKKTQSYIRTRSSQNSAGYNEIRFEDQAGAEFISVHAQRNLLERVLHDHKTHVGHDQRNEVDNDQELIVHNNRTKTVDMNEDIVVKGSRDATIGQDGGNEKLWVINNQEIQVDGNRELRVALDETIEVRGIRDITIGGTLQSTVAQGITQTIQNGGWMMTTTGNVSHTITGGMIVDTSDGITLNAGANVSVSAAQGVAIRGQQITLRSNTEIQYSAPGGMKDITPSRRQTTAQEVAEYIVDRSSFGTMKISGYMMALALYARKIDVVGVKVDLTMNKFEKKDLATAIDEIHLAISPTARLLKASITTIG